MYKNKIDQFVDFLIGKDKWPFGQNFVEVPMPRISGMTVLSGDDVAKVQIELCAIKNCDKPAVKKWRETSEMFNVCESHESMMEKAKQSD